MMIPQSLYLGAFFPALDSLFSTQGIMVMLLVAYAGAMWMFLTSAPKVYTIMVSDLGVAQALYEGLLNLTVADVPLHYYYNYEQSLSAASVDPLYGMAAMPPVTNPATTSSAGLWYQLKKNTQLHVIVGAQYGNSARERHVCFDRDCLELLLLRVQSRRLRFKLRSRRPVNFLVKDIDDRVIEFAEVAS
ncbi:MAG: glyoxalase-like domain protein [Cyanobacteria bacterium P01_G01_bin.54]